MSKFDRNFSPQVSTMFAQVDNTSNAPDGGQVDIAHLHRSAENLKADQIR